MSTNQQSSSYKTIEKQIRLRIRLAVAAYAYEYKNDSIMSDAEFDELSNLVDPSITTGNRKMDNFFKKHFEPASGMWVRMHPNKDGLRTIYERYFNRKGKHYVNLNQL